MELILSTDIAKAIPSEIGFNFEELKTQLAESLDKYNNLVVTEDAIQPAKKDRAALNALYNAVEDKRKSVKEACLAPYKVFEAKTKELTGMIQQPISAIDNQLKEFEETKRNEKYDSIERFYRDNIKELRDLIPLEKILPEKWANSGTTLISITKDIMEAISKARNDMGIIQKMKLDFEPQIIDVYLRTLDMGAALNEKVRLEEQAKALEEAKKQREKEAAIVVEPVSCPVEEAPQAVNEPETTKDIKVIFYSTTEAFRLEMRALAQKHNIKYGGVN